MKFQEEYKIPAEVVWVKYTFAAKMRSDFEKGLWFGEAEKQRALWAGKQYMGRVAMQEYEPPVKGIEGAIGKGKGKGSAWRPWMPEWRTYADAPKAAFANRLLSTSWLAMTAHHPCGALGSDSFHLNPGSDANCVTLDKLLDLSLFSLLICRIEII